MSREPRLLCEDALAAGLTPDDGSVALVTSSVVLGDLAGVEVGLWEAGPGTDTDVEVDEVFVVLAGAGAVTFEADGTTVDLRPGTVVRLRAGDRTTWRVTERLRKLYVAR